VSAGSCRQCLARSRRHAGGEGGSQRRSVFFFISRPSKDDRLKLPCKQVGSAKSLVVATRESCSRRNSDWPRGSGTRSRLRGSGDVSAGQVRYKRADPKPGLSRRDIGIEITVAQPCLDISEKAFQEWLVTGSLAQGRPAIDENESHGPPRKKSPVEKIVSGCFAVGYG
jgi:hypothetical protein